MTARDTPMGGNAQATSYAQQCIDTYATEDGPWAIPVLLCINVIAWFLSKHVSKHPLREAIVFILDAALAIACIRLFQCAFWSADSPEGLKLATHLVLVLLFLGVKRALLGRAAGYGSSDGQCSHGWLRDTILPARAYKLNPATVHTMVAANDGEFPHRAMLSEFLAVANSEEKYRGSSENVSALRSDVVRRYSRPRRTPKDGTAD